MRRPTTYLLLFFAGFFCIFPDALFSQSRFATAHPGMEWHARGTGRTTGHVLDLLAFNASGEAVHLDLGPFVVPSNGYYQGYVIPFVHSITVPAFGFITVPVQGYCIDISKPALPRGSLLFNSSDWIAVDLPALVAKPEWDFAGMGFEPFLVTEDIERVLTYPGTDIAFRYQIDIDAHLFNTAAMLVDAAQRIADAAYKWMEDASATTILDGMQEEKRLQTFVQHGLWYYTSLLRGKPYGIDYFTERIIEETEVVVDAPSEAFTQTALSNIGLEVDAIWAALMAINTNALIQKDPDVLGDSWGIHHQRWVREAMLNIDPNQRDAGMEMVRLADTLDHIRDYLGDLFIEKIRGGIAVKLGDFFKFQLGKLKRFEQLNDWIYLESLTHTTAFESLEPATREVIREELKKKMDRWIRNELRSLSSDELGAWIELEALVGLDVIHSNLEPSTQSLLGESMGIVFRDYALSRAHALDPSDTASLRAWVELETLVLCPWYDRYVPETDRKEIRRILGDKFSSFLKTQTDQLDPQDTSCLRKWRLLEILIYTDWFEEYVTQGDQAEIVKKLGEKFTSFLRVQMDRLDPSDTSMLRKWRLIEILVYTDWFETYVSGSARNAIMQKLKEKFTAWLKETLYGLRPYDAGMINQWRSLEALIYTDWFETFISESDRKEILKVLKEKFTTWFWARLDDLDPGDPDFLKKLLSLEALIQAYWSEEYMGKPDAFEKELEKKYQQWKKKSEEAVDYAQINWPKMQWTGDRMKHFFAGSVDKRLGQGWFEPWMGFVGGSVPVLGVATYLALKYPLPPQANPNTLILFCLEDGLIDVLSNDTGRGIRVVSFEQPAGAVVSDLGLGFFKIAIDLVDPVTQLSFSYTIEDVRGRTSTSQVQIKVVLPEIQVQGEVYDANSNSILSGNVLANDIGTGLQVVDYTQPEGGSLTLLADGSFTFTPQAGFCESTLFNYTVVDACQQTAGASTVISLNDTDSPVISCPPDITINCEDAPDPSFTGQSAVTDNCTENPTLVYVDEYGGSPCDQILTRTWTATDEVGLTNSCDQLIHIVDVTVPQVTCPPNVNISCEQNPDPFWTGSPLEYSDNCTHPLDLQVTYLDEFLGAGGAGPLERTWKVTDPCENVGSCVQMIMLSDSEGPVITCPPDLEITCGVSPDPGNTGYPEVSDNCTLLSEIDIQFEDQLMGSGCLENIIRTWAATDGADNTSLCEQMITRVDDTAPEISCPANVQVACGQEMDLALVGQPIVFDECGDPPVVEYTDDLSGLAGCEGNILRTWTAIDICGNASFCQQIIQILPADCDFAPFATLAPAICSAPVGEISLNVNPPGDYVFQWSTGSDGPVASGLFPGSYEVTIHDVNGFCTEIFSFDLPEGDPDYIINTIVQPDLCIEPGNITLLLNDTGSGLYDISVSGPNNFSLPPQGPGEVVIGDFGDLPPGNYLIMVSDVAATPGCGNEILVNVPYMPPYILQVTYVVHPTAPSTPNGAIGLSVSGSPTFPLALIVNGNNIGMTFNTNIQFTGLAEGTYKIMIIDDGGNGCSSNPVTVELVAGSLFDGQILTDLPTPSWSDWAAEAMGEDPGIFVPEHPVLEPAASSKGWQEMPVSIGLGYFLNPRIQLRGQLGFSNGHFYQLWKDPTAGTYYQFESSFRAWVQEGGFRYYLPSRKGSIPFFGLGLNWQHLSFFNTHLQGTGYRQVIALDPIDRVSSYLSAGMRWRLGQRGYLELEGRVDSPMAWGQSPEFSFRPMIGLGF